MTKDELETITEDINSPFFDISATKYGRGCIAKRFIPRGTTVLETFPLCSTISWNWRKEVCPLCFLLAKLKYGIKGYSSLRFCTEECKTKFEYNDKDYVLSESLLKAERAYLASKKRLAETSTIYVEERPEDVWNMLKEWDSMIKPVKVTKRYKYIPTLDEYEYDEARFVITLLFKFFVNDPLLRFYDVLQSNEKEKLDLYPDILGSYVKIYKFVKLSIHESLENLLNVRFFRNSIGRVFANAFGIWSKTSSSLEDKEYYGFALYPSAAFFNHSCSPNLEKARREEALVITAKKDIQLGEELCINYGNLLSSNLLERRQSLKEWNFDCLCERCITESKFT